MRLLTIVRRQCIRGEEEKVLVKGKNKIELSLLSMNNFCNNSSYQLLSVGYMPITLFSTFYGFCQVILINIL